MGMISENGAASRRSLVILVMSVMLSAAVSVSVPAVEVPSGPGWQPWLQPSDHGDLSRLDKTWELLAEKMRPILNDGSAGLQQSRLAGQKAPASINAIVLMCDFSDSLMYGRFGLVDGDFPDPMQSDFYFAAHDSVFFAHQMQNIAEYYSAVSDGQFTMNYEVFPQTVNLPQPMAWYGNHDELGEQPEIMVAEVVAAVDDEVDFSLFDTVILVHAGAGEETDILDNSPEQIYSTYLSPEDFVAAVEDSVLTTPYIPTDDIEQPEGITHVLILPETEFQDPVGAFAGYFGSLGVYCFEVGLRLGMLSLSDFTPSGRPDSQGIGEFGLMGYGLFVGAGFIPPHPCIYNKLLMGWANPYTADYQDNLKLTPSEACSGMYAAARVEITGREYWLLSYRLQDPDGNGIFSFTGDRNGNNVPDFYDADSAFEDGTPTGFFDAETDTLEYLTGAEWDFFMSENNARAPGVKGAGNGLYIWHIDEGVLADAFSAETNLFNADPQRKSVDLEEADGIQDLDSRASSSWILGGDDDSFRGEDNDTFGPRSNPATVSAGGAWTGFSIDNISNVVIDSLAVHPDDSTVTYVAYADTMTYSCFREDAPLGEPYLRAEHLFAPGVDLRGSHLVAARIDPDTCAMQIVVTGQGGEVFLFDADLQENLTPAISPGTLPWNGSVAVGNLAGDNGLEIMLTRQDGVFGFNRDLTTVRFADPDRYGLLAELDSCSLAPILVPREGTVYSRSAAVVACVVDQRSDGSYLRFIDELGEDFWPEINLGPVVVPAPPTLHQGVLCVAAIDTVGDQHKLLLMETTRLDTIPNAEIALAIRPNTFPVLLGRYEFEDYFAVVTDTSGVARTIWFDPVDLAPTARQTAWLDDRRLSAPLAPGMAVTQSDLFGLATRFGAWHEGWPVRPSFAFEPAPEAIAPAGLSAWLDYRRVHLFTSRDGRLFLYDEDATPVPGWPLPGPADAAGTPVLMDINDDGVADLVTVGSFPRVVGLDSEGEELVTEMVSRLMVWTGLGEYNGAGGGWAMWGGTPWRGGGIGRQIAVTEPVGSELLLADSHVCYPSPMIGDVLTVRAEMARDGVARVMIYNLEGQHVFATNELPVLATEPFEIPIDLAGVVTGLYICRLQVKDNGNGIQESVVTFAVVK